MNSFPRLKSGAIMQWPAVRGMNFSTEVLVFADGSEQRFRNFSHFIRRWIVQLDELDEEDLTIMEGFYAQQQGRVGTFSFVDPWDGTVHAECQFDDSDMVAEYRSVLGGSARLIIREVT
ncbi:MAG: DUF2460 domain-containing protein [Acidobacteriota bacterium]